MYYTIPKYLGNLSKSIFAGLFLKNKLDFELWKTKHFIFESFPTNNSK